MNIWLKRGVFGDLIPSMQKALGKIIDLYQQEGREDFYITCIREGNHANGSFHPIGYAVDFLKQLVPYEKIVRVLGDDYDVIDEVTHYHVEYDRKGGK
jgi:hypothetical protein